MCTVRTCLFSVDKKRESRTVRATLSVVHRVSIVLKKASFLDHLFWGELFFLANHKAPLFLVEDSVEWMGWKLLWLYGVCRAPFLAIMWSFSGYQLFHQSCLEVARSCLYHWYSKRRRLSVTTCYFFSRLSSKICISYYFNFAFDFIILMKYLYFNLLL